MAETKALLEKKLDTDKDCCKLYDEAKEDYEGMYLNVCGSLKFITMISSLCLIYGYLQYLCLFSELPSSHIFHNLERVITELNVRLMGEVLIKDYQCMIVSWPMAEKVVVNEALVKEMILGVHILNTSNLLKVPTQEPEVDWTWLNNQFFNRIYTEP